MSRLWCAIVACCLFFGATPVLGQVVETTPDPPRTDRSMTLFFNADEGTGGLEDHDGEVYAHTGISTSENEPKAWKCVKNYWPSDGSFSGNRDDTKLTKVEGTENRYKLEINDIRAYYQATSTSCSLSSDEEIRTMNMVFRDAEGEKEGKAEGGNDIFVDVLSIGDDPFVSASILSPSANPPLYPFITASDTTVTVEVSADTANVDSFSELRLYVDGTQVTSSADSSLSYNLDLTDPNRFDLRAEAEAKTSDTTLVDTVKTFLLRSPDVVTESRPEYAEDGISYNPTDPTTVTLSLYAPKKEFVYAIGDFSDWEVDNQYFMKRDQEDPDRWWITLDGLGTNRQYDLQYFVDGEIRTSDPFSHKVRTPADREIGEDIYPGLEDYPSDKTENFVSVIRPGQQQSSFQFSDFDPPERENLVIYELLLRDFVKKSTFSVLTDTLDYLDRLGVNAVELMPVSNFGGNNSWGYNPNAHLAPDKSYGPPEDFKKFVEEAHSRGIAVIMDVVYNHITDQSPLVQLYSSLDENPFIISSDRDRNFCDDFFRELDQGSPFIQKYIDRANRYWIEEFNVDGFRFDLAKCVADDGININDSGHSEAVTEGWKRVSDYVWDEVDADTYMILEFFGDPSVENELGGYRADNTGGMMTWHNMNRPYSEADMGYVGGTSGFGSGLLDTYFGTRSGYDQPSFIAYMESHDEQWLMRRKKEFGRSDSTYTTKELDTALNRQKLVGAFYFTVPGPRMMWQFGELGYGWNDDECLRDGGGEDGPCSTAPGRTSPKPIRWEYRDPDQSPGRVKLYKTWSSLINLRNQTDVFTSLQTDVSMKVSDGDVGRRLVLQHDSMDAVVIGNFGIDRTSVSANFSSAGTWYDYFTGTAVEINDDETDTPIPLAPGEFHVFTSKDIESPEAGLVPYSSAAPPPDKPSTVETEVGTEEITVSWSASSSSDLTGYALYRGQTSDFDTTGARIARVGSGTTSYTDTEVSSGQAYYYQLVALDADGARSDLTQPVRGLLYPETVSVDVTRSFGQGERKQDYRLVALPGQVNRSIAETLSGESGEAWQAYWDNGAESDFFVQFDGSSTFQLEPGRGFWLISDSSWSVQTQVSTVPLSEQNTTTIDVHDGWNIISNPFDRGVPWSDVVSESGGGLQPLWTFDGSFSQVSTFASARTGKAFYFLNDQGLDQLTVPYSATTSSTKKTEKRSDVSPLTLEVQQGDAESTVQVGWSENAKEGLDAFDWVAPPSRFSALSLRTRAEQVQASRQQSLARSVRPRNDRGQSFPLTLQAETTDPVQLRAKNPAVFANQELRLVNEKTGTSHDLHKEPSREIQPSSETTTFTLLVGTKSYVESKEEALSASELQLRPGYPNPFRQNTTLSYTLPEDGTVKLEVFDVLGRRVRVLVDERKEAGTYEATWNGGNDAGSTVSSGVYLGRLTFDGKTITQKMVLVK